MQFDLKYWYLRNLEIFNALDKNEIRLLTLISDFKSPRQHDIVYPFATEIDRIYFLIAGRVKVAYCIQNNTEVVSEILKEGDVFGELTLKKSVNSHGEFAQVLSEEAITCSFLLDKFEKILSENARLATSFSKMVAEKLKIVSGKYSDLVFKDVRARVLNFFMLHAQYEGKWSGNKAEIDMYCTHQDIANFTASKRQTVTTVINHLVREKKIIYHGRSKVIIPDVKKLEA